MTTTSNSDIPLPREFPHVLVVQASAGAGKTYSLGLRFLQLLARAGSPSTGALGSILALTFTVAAAQEMKSRIIAFLKDIALETPAGSLLREQSGLNPAAAAAWLDCILEHFQRFQVKTIDSLHFQLVQALGKRMNLCPELEASFDQSAWSKVVLEGLLARTDWDQLVISGSGPEATDSLLGLWDGIFQVYLHQEMHSGLRFLPWLEKQVRGVVSDLNQLLTPLAATSLDDLRAAQSQLLHCCREMTEALERAGILDQVSRFDAADKLGNPLAELDSAFFTKTSATELFKKKVHCHPALPECWDLYMGVCRARNAYLLARARLHAAPLARLQLVVSRELERLGQSQGLLMGGWWTRLIRQHLDREELLQEAAMILGMRWRHLLIDEFQDTSREQWEVLRELAVEALSEGGSLFCVGDVKQAIYRWRGGDWRLFFEPLDPRVTPNVPEGNRMRTVLPFNRRSCPEVVAWNNACFASLDKPDAAMLLADAMIPAKEKTQARSHLASTITELYAESAQLPWKECSGAIHVTEIKAEDTQEYKAKAMLTLIAEIEALHARGVSHGDMAVLVRTNTEAGECAQNLLAASIPTITEQSLVISGHPAVRGLLALLTWLDNPGDDAALDALCRNPLLFAEILDDVPDMCTLLLAAPVPLRKDDPLQAAGCVQPGMREEAHIVGGEDAADGDAPRNETAAPLYRRLQEAHPAFWAEHLEPFWKHAGFRGAYELLLAAVAHFRLRELPLGQWAWVEKLLESALNAEAQGYTTLSGFLEFWQENGSFCVVGLPEGLAAVRVMTMHKAKGLEFPQVFLPLLGYGDKNRPAHLLFQSEDEAPYLAATTKPRCAEVTEFMDSELIKTMAEELNLLYVALTRARAGLHIFLADTETARSSHAASWLRAVMPG
ncbi:ATP-dependent exoDNAse (exonuclease V) beta subunit (contains helicase and exonuclease domains) [Desulfonatronum thiosulfatophilum]|uniref:DNA 3'-5' helicase n=1 Tax=Desulfonatronum thiosulfatophilum TaxID=617002 RepID=A0A1G6DF11_9BACT|nr:UvrD-helicase domain-containing protein [Desulfonatronum thiosulfatophilum]SDB43722.1 ATP-dependent exoDNAse (exonuclease V) beta subunit (contains helicase and exonuclease domains) [Desulfonatronum thiosulfatophilum]